MRITYSHIEVESRGLIESECARQSEKLDRLLKRYAPDSVQLHVSLERTPRRMAYDVSLNLTLSTGTLHATGSGSDVRAGTKAAFAEIGAQVKKHQEKLRKDYVWKRKRARGPLKPGAALAE